MRRRCFYLLLALAACSKKEPTPEEQQRGDEIRIRALAAAYADASVRQVTVEPGGEVRVGPADPTIVAAADKARLRHDALLDGGVAHEVACDAPHSRLSLAVGDTVAKQCRDTWDKHQLAVTTTMDLELTAKQARDPDLGRQGPVEMTRKTAAGCELRFSLLEPEFQGGFAFELVEVHGRVTGMMWYWDSLSPRSCGHGFHVAGTRE